MQRFPILKILNAGAIIPGEDNMWEPMASTTLLKQEMRGAGKYNSKLLSRQRGVLWVDGASYIQAPAWAGCGCSILKGVACLAFRLGHRSVREDTIPDVIDKDLGVAWDVSVALFMGAIMFLVLVKPFGPQERSGSTVGNGSNSNKNLRRVRYHRFMMVATVFLAR